MQRVLTNCVLSPNLEKNLSFLENTVLGENNHISFEKSTLDYYCGEDLEEFIQNYIPEMLTSKRTGALCIGDALVWIFKDWVYYDDTEDMVNFRKDTTRKTIHIDDEGIVKMIQKMVGDGTPKVKHKYCSPNEPNDPATIILSNV